MRTGRRGQQSEQPLAKARRETAHGPARSSTERTLSRYLSQFTRDQIPPLAHPGRRALANQSRCLAATSAAPLHAAFCSQLCADGAGPAGRSVRCGEVEGSGGLAQSIGAAAARWLHSACAGALHLRGSIVCACVWICGPAALGRACAGRQRVCLGARTLLAGWPCPRPDPSSS